eukprot:m.154959 g.154959  ORF g.154959 m.154959 type:complete len:950 (+) comp38649_c2_seq2:125-2974(+)
MATARDLCLLEGSDGKDEYSRLQAFLVKADVFDFFKAIYYRLGIRRIKDLKDMTANDAERINMTNPQFLRLKRYYDKEKSVIYRFFHSGTKLLPRAPSHSRESSESRFLIARDNVTTGRLLGEGEYGQVYQGDWRGEGGSMVSVAVKTLHKDAEPRFTVEIQKEIDAMSTVNHPNIIRLYGVVLSSPIMLVLELAPLGSLETLLIKEGPAFPVLRLYQYAQQIASGMEYLAEKSIVHRDLAARNILLVTKAKPKISDFGLARPLAPGRKYYEMTNPKGRVAFGWTAPEALKTSRFTVQSDVWSYGVLLWEMFSHGDNPWGECNAMQILEMVDAPLMRRLPQTEDCVADVHCLMNKCWSHDPDERPTFTALRKLIVDIWPHKGRALTELNVENDPKKLSFSTGEIITITKMNSGQYWWFGQNERGNYGSFPEDHVKILEDCELHERSPVSSQGHEMSPPRTADDISRPTGVTNVIHIGHDDISKIPFEDLEKALKSKAVTPLKPAATQDFSRPPPLPLKNRGTQPTFPRGDAPTLPPPNRRGTGVVPNDLPPPYTPHDRNQHFRASTVGSIPLNGDPRIHPYVPPFRSDMPNPPPSPLYLPAPLPRSIQGYAPLGGLVNEIPSEDVYEAMHAPQMWPSPTKPLLKSTSSPELASPVEEHVDLLSSNDYVPMRLDGGARFVEECRQFNSSSKPPSDSTPENIKRQPVPKPRKLPPANKSQGVADKTGNKVTPPTPAPRSHTSSRINKITTFYPDGHISPQMNPRRYSEGPENREPLPSPPPKPRGTSQALSPQLSPKNRGPLPSLPIIQPKRQPKFQEELPAGGRRLSGWAICVREVQNASENVTDREAQMILSLYEWKPEDAIFHLNVVSGVGLSPDDSPKKVREVIMQQAKDPQKSMEELAIQKVIEFAHGSGIEKKMKKKDARKILQQCHWKYEAAINCLADKKATKK